MTYNVFLDENLVHYILQYILDGSEACSLFRQGVKLIEHYESSVTGRITATNVPCCLLRVRPFF